MMFLLTKLCYIYKIFLLIMEVLFFNNFKEFKKLMNKFKDSNKLKLT